MGRGPLAKQPERAFVAGDILVHDGTELRRLGVGTNGQILVAESSLLSGLGIYWADRWPFTAKGDLISTANGSTGAALPLGDAGSVLIPNPDDLTFGLAWLSPAAASDGDVLMVDSTLTSGVKWATPAGGPGGGDSFMEWAGI